MPGVLEQGRHGLTGFVYLHGLGLLPFPVLFVAVIDFLFLFVALVELIKP